MADAHGTADSSVDAKESGRRSAPETRRCTLPDPSIYSTDQTTRRRVPRRPGYIPMIVKTSF